MLSFSGTFSAFYYLFYKSSFMKVGPKSEKVFFFAIPPEDMFNDEVQSVVYIRCCTHC